MVVELYEVLWHGYLRCALSCFFLRYNANVITKLRMAMNGTPQAMRIMCGMVLVEWGAVVNV